MAAALAGSPLFRGRFQKAVAISGGLSLADPDAAAQKLAENFAPLAVEDGRFADTASAAEWLLTPGADVREWLCGLEPARIAALGKPAILYADDVVLSWDARSAVPLLLLSSATEFSGFVRDDLRPASSAARAYAVKYGSALCRWSSTEAVAEALGSSAPVWLGLIDYGGADSQTAVPGLGSFHGLPLALFSPESSYSACADLSSAGAQALSARLKQALAGFMTSGSPAGTPGRRKTATPSTSMPTAKQPASPSAPTRIPRKVSAPPWPQTHPSPPPKRKRWSTSIFPVSPSDEAKTHLTDHFHR